MVLGFQALMKLGHRFTVAGLECHIRRHCEEYGNHRYEIKPKEREDDEISFLDEDEAKRINEWRD